MTEEEFFKRYSFNVRKDKIGGGSFGTVYKAYDNVLDREVAVKVSEVRMSGDKEFSLRAEFKAIEKLPPHANIANYEEVHTFESFNGVFDYAIMQYYPLGNLDHFLSNNSLDVSKKEDLILAILEGISHLHNFHIVQRDLKPSNILIVDRKGKLIPKITDFGLSKQAGTEAEAARFTNSFAGGTLQYCSPEQIKGLPLKLNTDLWSFGAIAFEIFMGYPLFQVEGRTSASAEWQNEVSKKILYDDYSEKLDKLPKNWAAVVGACLERDMDRRAQNAQELLSILNADAMVNSAPTEVFSSADNNATKIFNETSDKKEADLPKETQQEKKAEPKAQPTKPKANKKKSGMVWMGIAAGFAAVVAVYFFGSNSEVEAAENDLSTELVLFQKDSLYGYRIGDSTVIDATFNYAEDFNEERAKVKIGDSTFYIDPTGAWIASFTENEETEAGDLTESDSDEDSHQNEKEKEKINENNHNSSEVISLSEQKVLYEKGETFFNKKEYIKAYENLLPIAKLGHHEAQFLLGKMYYNGFAVDQNFTKAYEWYLKASNQGNVKAQNNIGFMYHYGNSHTKQDYSKALTWYLKAANNGNEVAMKNVGVMYENGYGVKQNYEKAMEWYLKAAENEESGAMNHVGTLYQNGEGVDKDYGKAAEWYKKAAEAGDKHGQYNLGRLYWDGNGMPEDNDQALKWFRKAAEQGHTTAMAYIGFFYDVVEEGGYDWEKARQWYEKAANNGNAWGKRELGEFYMFGLGGVSQNEEKAKELFTEAANAGNEKAKTYLQVIADLEKGKYYQLDNSQFGNKFFLSIAEIEEEYELSPAVLDNYSDLWTTELSYELGSSVGVQIFPYSLDSTDDKITYARYSPSSVLQEDVGIKPTSIGWDSYPSGKYEDGSRQIGYMYFQAHFYNKNGSNEETLRIKVPAMLCWKPKRYYEE